MHLKRGYLLKLNAHLLWNPEIPILSVCPREMKTYTHTKTYKPIVIAALLVIAKNWRQPRCPSMDTWVSGVVHAYHRLLLSSKRK